MKRFVLIIVLALLVSPVLVTVNDGSEAFGFFGSHKKVKSVDGKVLIPLKDVDDGEAHFFRYKDGKKEVKFFVVKSSDGVIRAAFDACDVCFPAGKGYSRDGDFMICNNCNRRFHSSRINEVKGGCNPAPLARQVVGENLVVSVEDIIPGVRFF